MLTRVLGYLFIIVAGTGFGYGMSREMQCHLQELEHVKQIFMMMRSELNYTRATFEEVFERIGEKIGGRYGKWLDFLSKELKKKKNASFWEVWKESIEKELKDSYLKKKDLEALKSVGKNLAYFENIDLYIEQLEYEIQKMRGECQTKGKLYKSIGIMGGIFLVILLL